MKSIFANFKSLIFNSSDREEKVLHEDKGKSKRWKTIEKENRAKRSGTRGWATKAGKTKKDDCRKSLQVVDTRLITNCDSVLVVFDILVIYIIEWISSWIE